MCVLACQPGPDGNVDPTCAYACPRGASSVGATDEQALDECRATGGTGMCSSCGESSGDGGNPIIHQMCTQVMDTTPCYTCEDNSCCNTYAACKNDPACQALKNCIVSCAAPDGGIDAGAQSCDQYCAGLNPAGVATWAPRETCIFAHCLAPCGGTDPCVGCVVSSCAEEYANLQGTVDGYLLGLCIAPCGSDVSCGEACEAKYPSAAPAANALALCTQAKCAVCPN